MGYRTLYMRPSDNVIPAATLTVQTGTASGAYPLAGLQDRATCKPFKLVETSGAIQADLGSAKEVGLITIHNTNLDAGLEVRVKANSSAAWGAPPLNQVITIPGIGTDKFSVDPFLDLTVALPNAVDRTYRYWLLQVVGANSAAVAISEWCMGVRRELPHNVTWNFQSPDSRPLVEHPTDAGSSLRYSYGTRQLSPIVGTIETVDAGWEALYAWWQDAGGRALGFPLVPDPYVNKAYFALWSALDISPTAMFLDGVSVQVGWQEMGRGLPLVA